MATLDTLDNTLDTGLVAQVCLGGSLALLLILTVANASECATVSCATDNGELSDRTSSVALTFHAIGSASLWAQRRAPTALAAMDVTLLLALALVSSDVASVAHNYIALCFMAVRVILFVSFDTSGGAQDIVSLYLVVALRSCSLVFVLGYACPNVIPEVCVNLSANTALSRPAALAVETAMVVCGLMYMIAMVTERPGWRADALSLVALGVAVVGNVVLAILRPSIGGTVLLAIGSSIDIALASRLRKFRESNCITLESVPLAMIILAPLVYALI